MSMSTSTSTPFLLALLTILGAVVVAAAPPQTWREHWFEHNQNLDLVYTNDDVAIYFDSDVDRSITWPNSFISDVWRYVKEHYGDFGQENNLYAIFHTGKYSGGHPSTYFDASHDNRNVIDVGSNSPTAWLGGSGNDLDIVAHEIAHVVEGASRGVHNSPAFPIWGDSKWAEIFNYDVYNKLGMTSDATRWYDMMIQGSDDFPARGTFWFRDWFYPIYSQHGETSALTNFFSLMAQYYPKNGGGTEYTRNMNMGEFVHFWSGAASTNLLPMAANAFGGWTLEWDNQLRAAKSEFPDLPYDWN